MIRVLSGIFALLLSVPVMAHDFTSLLYGGGMVAASFVWSVYLVGSGLRVKAALFFIIAWGILWSSIYWGSSLMPLMFGSMILIFAQPAAAIIYKRISHV